MTISGENPDHWYKPSSCLYCGFTELSPWISGIGDRLGFVPGAWSFLKCERCGSAHLSPMPKLEVIPDLYPPVYSFRPDFETKSKLKRLVARVEERFFYRLLHRNEVSSIRKHSGTNSGSLLDVGCGTGDRLTRFARAGYTVRGLEIQPELVEYVRNQLGYNVDAGTLDSFYYPDNSFELVTICWVIEHLAEVKSVLKKIHGMLKPNGWIVAEVPLTDSYQSEILGSRWCQYCEAPRHLSIPSQNGVERAFRASGYTDIKILPSTVMTCAGIFALSLVPNATATHAYGNSSMATHLPRFIAGAATVLYTPMVILENYIMRRPACSLVLARKP